MSPGGPGQPVKFSPGTRVRAACEDPDHHTRMPRYLRGHVGEVVTAQGQWPLPDDVARGVAAPRVQTVYTVRFSAADLWGTGRHTVAADLWEAYLEKVAPEGSNNSKKQEEASQGEEDADNSKKRPSAGEAS